MSLKAARILLLICLNIIAINEARKIFQECEHIENGNFVAPANATQEHNCIAYIYCNGTESFTDICPLGTYFDAETQECAFDEDGRCQFTTTTTNTPITILSSSSTSADTSSTLHTFTSTDTFNISSTTFIPNTLPSLSGRPKCTIADKDNYFPHASRCEYYYKCIGTDYLVIMRCNMDYFWDYKRQECLPAKEAKCFKNERRSDRLSLN